MVHIRMTLFSLFFSVLMGIVQASNTSNFEDLGAKFRFRSERGGFVERSIEDYQIVNKSLYDAVSQKKALIFGGMHLSAEQAYDLSKAYARQGKHELMINVGIPLHTGHVTINLDPQTQADYVNDFTTPDLIKTLKLEGQFEIACFENVRPSLTLSVASLKNAWDALKPGGRLIIYPAAPFMHETFLSSLGFTGVKMIETGYKDILRDSVISFPVCVAQKPESS